MSSDRQRLVNSIRRIALTPEERRQLLGDSANRGDQAGAGAKAASQGEQDRICCDGSTAPPNAGSEERDPDASAQTGLDPDDPARLTAGDGTLSGVTDCATGEPICMDGSGFIPPDGWDAPNEPPPVEAHDFGPSVNCADFSSKGQTLYNPEDKHVYALACAEEKPSGFNFSSQITTCTSGFGACPGVFISYPAIWRSASTYSEPPVPEGALWPSDGCVNLALKSGTIVGSKYDPDQSGAYSTPKDSIQLCDNANGTSILYQPLPGGGFRTIESSGGVAVTDAVGYTYSSDGTLTGTITQAEWDATAP